MLGPLEPIAPLALLKAAGMYAGLVFFVLVTERLPRRSGPFLAASVSVAVLTATLPFSLGSIVAGLPPLCVVALATSVALALLLHRRAGESPGGDGALVGVSPSLLVRHLSWLGIGLMNAAFAFLQYDLFGFLQPQMGLHLALWWGYLFLLFAKQGSPLMAWERRSGRAGFLAISARLVLVPLVFSLGGWILLAKLLWQPPLWKLAGMGLAGGAGLAALWAASDPRIEAAAEVFILACIALSTGFESPLPYLMPVAALLFGGARLFGGKGAGTP